MNLSRKRSVVCSLMFGLLAVAGTASAQTEAGVVPATPPPEVGGPVPAAPVATGVPSSLVDRSIVLPNGTLEIRQAGLNIGLSKDNAGKPLFLTIPNVSFGIADNLEVGIFSGDISPAVAPLGFVYGLCLSSSSSCPHRFDSIGVEGLYRFMAGNLQLAAHGVLNFAQISDPMRTRLFAGVLGKWVSGQFALVFDPAIFFGLTNRDKGASNKEGLSIPVSAQLQLQPQIALYLNTGLYGPFDHFGDLYQIPVGVGGLFNVNPMIDVGATFTFINLLGKQVFDEGRADARALFLFANIRPIAI